jgi:outer membrane protein assembly factor BamB
VRRAALATTLVLLGAAAIPAWAPAVARHYPYAVPVQASSPWPEMRRDGRNTGASPIRGGYRGGRPWSFATGRGIFSTPVIGGDGTVYVGSADGNFYAVAASGRLRWRLRTGGIIDAAAAIGRYRPGLGTAPITIGSGDERLYHLRSDPRPMPRKRRILWRFRPTLPPVPGQLVSWWEGNVAIGPGGTIYAGNTGGAAYAIDPGGELRWVAPRGNSVWTTPAFGQGAEAGNSFWGSVDLNAFSLDAAGAERWQTFTPGYVISSPALGSDGTVYVGSFDHNLYALDPDTGAVRWTLRTDAHLYSSPALADTDGVTTAIYIASADGQVYAVDPSGHLLWRYDTGDAVRSSPVVGRAPNGRGRIVYVGSSNGKLYALDAATGRRRWSFDTTPHRPLLRDRNDLNASPALGRRGIYIAGEDGRLWFVPYDYCLHHRRARCDRHPGQDFGPNLDRMLYVTPGGTTTPPGARPTVSPATTIATRLIVRRGGRTEDAALQQPAGSTNGLVDARPRFRFRAELSGDGHYLFIRPRGFLRPGTDYRLRVRGRWRTVNGPPDAGAVDSTVRLRTARGAGTLPLRSSSRRVSAFTISRLALPLPPLLPSVNQIGFDSYDMIAGTIGRSPSDRSRSGRVLVWVVGAHRDRQGIDRPDPAGNFQFPLLGRYRGGLLELNARSLALQFSFGPVPVRNFDLRGRIGANLEMRPGAGIFAETTCGDVPNYGAQLRVAGLCNSSDTLAASGTLLTDRYRDTSANRRPPGVRLASLALRRPTATSDGLAVARLALAGGMRYPARTHVGSILLTNARTGIPIALDYHAETAPEVSSRGELRGVRLRIPAGTALPSRVRAYAIADVFPLGTRTFR